MMYTGTKLQGNRAVSPVIGVILMVAITVILAAVIGAFVLEIGDQQETAPNTSFDTNERSLRYTQVDEGGTDLSTDIPAEVAFTHAGGDTIDIRQLRIKTNGYKGALGPREHKSSQIASKKMVEVANHPNHIPALGSNEPVELTSGETMAVWAYGNIGPDEFLGSRCGPGTSCDGWPTLNPAFRGYPLNTGDDECLQLEGDADGDLRYDSSENSWHVWIDGSDNPAGGSSCDGAQIRAAVLEQDDDLRVTWVAESGGKTQTLHKYTVQSGDAPT